MHCSMKFRVVGMLFVLLSAPIFLAFAPSGALGAVPQLINFQGILRDGSGNPVANGSYSVVFTIYDAPTGGSFFWSETQSVNTSNGLFTVLLGSGSLPLDYSIFNDSTRWLGVKVGADPEMTPRQRLSSVGYSHNSSEWTSAAQDLFRLNGNVGIGTTSPGAKLHVNGPPEGIRIQGTTSEVTNQAYMTFYGGAGNRRGYVGDGSIGDHDVFLDADIGNIVLNTAAGRVLTADSNGNVGIGTVPSYPGTRLWVYNPGNAPSTLTGVRGETYNSGDACGGYFIGGSTSGFSYGICAAGGSYGVYGSGGTNGVGVVGTGDYGVYAPGVTYGVYGKASAFGGAAIYGLGVGNPAYTYAGYFSGGVVVTGALAVDGFIYKNGGGFRIDHPTDPANKYLYHSFVESPDMTNFYNGNVTLDARGEAAVQLPDWFGALNKDFRYQLTAIGAPGPNLFIAEEISENRFKIAGGTAGMKVSWQVTGIRKDAYAEAHRIPIEEVKSGKEQGKYLHPEEHGAPASLGMHYEETQKMIAEHKKMEEERVQMEAERKLHEEERAKMEQERLLYEQMAKPGGQNK